MRLKFAASGSLQRVHLALRHKQGALDYSFQQIYAYTLLLVCA